MSDVRWLREMTPAELFRRFPQTVSLFLEHGMACVGCDLSEMETIAEALAFYQLDAEQFLQKLAECVQTEAPPSPEERHAEEKP